MNIQAAGVLCKLEKEANVWIWTVVISEAPLYFQPPYKLHSYKSGSAVNDLFSFFHGLQPLSMLSIRSMFLAEIALLNLMVWTLSLIAYSFIWFYIMNLTVTLLVMYDMIFIYFWYFML